jgi:hypothetical protein
MRRPSPIRVLLPLLLLSVTAALAQQTPSSASASASTHTSSLDRLFINFIEDATIVDQQRWEGWFQYEDGDAVDISAAYGTAAFQLWPSTEVGGRVGFGKTDVDGTDLDGTGATDLDLWGKYYWNLGDRGTEIAAGAILTVPTGDDAAGLGFDAFGIKGFVAGRFALESLILTGTLGVQANESGRIFESDDIDGDSSFSIGGGVIVPWTDSFSLVGELSWKTGRFEDFEDDARVLGGLNLRLSDRGMLRPAVGIGLEDGAPDYTFQIGYAHSF